MGFTHTFVSIYGDRFSNWTDPGNKSMLLQSEETRMEVNSLEADSEKKTALPGTVPGFTDLTDRS